MSFTVDVTRDLERIDGVVTQLLRDRSIWSEFLQDPNGVLVRLGLHPPTTAEANARTNRVFYAVLSNRDLLQIALEMAQEVQPSDSEREFHLEGLRRGVIQNRIDYDLRGVNHIFSQTDRVRRIYQIALNDLNEKGILTRTYSQEELNDYIERMIQGVQNDLSINELPTLERWDDQNYGVGTGYGFGEVEVGPIATVGFGAEVVVVFTVGALIEPPENVNALFSLSLMGDSGSVRELDILTRLQDFTSDLLTHAESFESNG